MEETIDLKEYFGIIKKRFWIIALITIVATVVSGVVSFFVLSPVNQANTTLIVNTKENEETQMLTGDQYTVAQKLAVTYGEIIKSRKVLEPVIDELNLDMTYEALAQQVSVAPVKDTNIIKISIEDTTPTRARDIVNQVAIVFKKEITKITESNTVNVLDKAITPADPIKPNKMINVAIAAVLGMMIGLFVVFLIEYMDNKIKTPQDIEKHLGIPILGVIPDENIVK